MSQQESWIELLERMGVFAERQAEKCHWCKRDDGTVQMRGANQFGELYPLYKLCASCHEKFKQPRPKKRKGR